MIPVIPRTAASLRLALSLAVALLCAATPSARAQWTVTNLTLPSSTGSIINSGFGSRQAGYIISGGQYRASLWTSSVSLRVDLAPPTALYSEATGLSDTQQVGYAYLNNQYRALLWSGTAASAIDLTPAAATEAYAEGVSSGQQVGYVFSNGRYRASLWGGTAASWIDLSPTSSLDSYALGVGGGQQVGYAFIGDRYRAGMWSGSAATWVDLSPAAAIDSGALATSGGQQVGYVQINGRNRASLWNGTAASWTDLTPQGSTSSSAWSVYGGQQAGAATIDGASHASVWGGTAASWVDLHAFLTPEFTSSVARGIWSDEATTYVSGYAFNTATHRTEALLWTRPSPATCRANWNSLTTSGPGPRFASAMVFDAARNTLVLFGGGGGAAGATDPDDISSQTWTFSGSTWTLAATTGPAPRDLPAMVYDSARQKVVLFGGRTNSVSAGTETFLNDTWEWDGTSWSQRTTARAPSARFRAAASFDSARSVTVLSGGASRAGSGPYLAIDDLWEFNGTDWTQRTIAGSTPGPRLGAAMTFDASRNVSVLWGGLTDSSQFNDTWEYDGSTWTRKALTLAGLIGNKGLIAYDSTRHRVILTEGDLASIWSWDGIAWTALTPAPGPAARSFPALAYDPAHDTIVIQGGTSLNTGALSETLALPCPSFPWSLGTQPVAGRSCASGSKTFSVGIASNNPGPYTFQWQIQTSPGVWVTLGNDPLPLACGGSAFAQAASPNSPSVTIGIRPCTGALLAAQTFDIRCLASTACCTTPSVKTTYTICPADFDCNNTLAIADIFSFLNAWFAGSPAADVDGVPGLQIADIFAFLNAWFAGC